MSRPEIDLHPRQHSHSYELKPVSRWWFVYTLGVCLYAAWANGFERPTTWLLLLCGAVLGAFWLLCFPRLNLTKRG